MDDYIKRQAAKRLFADGHDYGLARRLDEIPTADVMYVHPVLRKAVELLNEEYKKATQLSFVRNPLAYALYQVWKMADAKGR